VGHIIIQLFSLFLFLDHGTIDCTFITTCHDKLTCHKILVFFVDKNVLMSFLMMYMFVNYICTKYIKACIHQGLKPKLHGITFRS
jgi:hypothetical protein